MTFRYILRTPDGATHTADSPEQFDALLDQLLAEFPDGEIELDAVVNDDELEIIQTKQAS